MYATREVHPEGMLVRWNNRVEAAGKAAADEFVIISCFNFASEVNCQFSGVRRSAGKYLWKLLKTLPDEEWPDV